MTINKLTGRIYTWNDSEIWELFFQQKASPSKIQYCKYILGGCDSTLHLLCDFWCWQTQTVATPRHRKEAQSMNGSSVPWTLCVFRSLSDGNMYFCFFLCFFQKQQISIEFKHLTCTVKKIPTFLYFLLYIRFLLCTKTICRFYHQNFCPDSFWLFWWSLLTCREGDSC